MKKNSIILIFGLAILAAVGGFFIFRDTPELNYDFPVPTQNYSDELMVSQPAPYTDIDDKLHIRKDTELDPSKIEIGGLNTVFLCWTRYKTKSVMIDGVDIVHRIAMILRENPEFYKSFCSLEQVSHTVDTGGMLGYGDELHITIGDYMDGYEVGISFGESLIDLSSGIPHSWNAGTSFMVNVEKNSISTFRGVVGALK